MDTIKKLVIKYKYYIILGLAILALLSTSILFSKLYYIEKSANTNNIHALSDSIEYYKTKNGNLVAEKTLLEGSISDLKITNENLYNKIKNMKVSDPDNVVYVTSTIEHEKHDTLWSVKLNTDTLYYNNIQKDFAFNNKYRELEGNVVLKDTTMSLSINKDKVYLDYTLVLKDNKVYIESDNPYVKYNEIQGLTITKSKQKRFGVGPTIGYGYDFISKRFSPFVGISLNYNLFQF